MTDVTLKAILVGEDRSLSKSMKGAGKSIDDVAKKSTTAGDVMRGILGSQIVSGAVDSLAQLVGEAARATDQTDKFKQTLSFAGFKNGAITKATKDARSYADATVYDLGTIQNTTAQLAANGVKDYTGLTKAVGNLNAVSGGSADTFKSVAMMLTQTAGAGKLTTENWNQLADAIPGASGVLQEQMRKNGAFTGDFRTAMAKGQITAAEFNKAIMQLGNKPVAQEAAKSTKTFEGAVGNLEATITGHLGDAIEGVKPTLIGLVNGFADVVDKMAELPGWVNENKGALTTLGGIVAVLAGGYVALAVAQSASSAAAAVQAAGGIIGFLKAWASQQAILNVVMSANPIALIVIAIAALVAGVILAYNNVEWFRDGVNAAFNAIGAAGRWLWNNALAPALRAIVNGFAWVVDGIASFLDALGNVPGFGWAKSAAAGLRGVAQSARDAAKGISNIPDPKVNTGKSQAQIAALDKKIRSLKGKVVEAKAKGDTKAVTRLQSEIRKLKGKKISIEANVRKTGISRIQIRSVGGGVYKIGSGFFQADGGILATLADGRVVKRFAGGGVEDHTAQIAPGGRGGAVRVWAEEETGGESYIPLAASKRARSREIWRETGKRLGMTEWADGGLLLPATSQLLRRREMADASTAVGRASSGGGDVYYVTLTAPPGAPRAYAASLERELYDLMKSRGPAGKLKFEKR